MKSESDRTAQRSYRQRARAASAAETEARIRSAASAAFAEQRFDLVSLDEIAQRAGVRVPTILRHFGSKESLFVQSTHELMLASQQERARAYPLTLRDVVTAIVAHFEQQGPLILHLLDQEEQVVAIRTFTDEGRRYHRQWVRDLVVPLLPDLSSTTREQLMVQIYALADVRFWQTLRHSLGQTRADTERSIFALMEGAISSVRRERT